MNIKVKVPDGESGDWKVSTFEVSKVEAKLATLRARINCGRGALPAGKYKKLSRKGVLVMSNTPDEIEDFMPFVQRAKGRVLINGLGLGILLEALLAKSDVTEVTVIEKSSDVIKLSADTYLKDKRVTIINADCFDYQPPKNKKYDCVWHDIWDYITADNLPEMKKLHRKYGRRTNYQESWCREECEQQKKRGGFR